MPGGGAPARGQPARELGPRIWWPSPLAHENGDDGFGPDGGAPAELSAALGDERPPAPERITGA
jgi:hypothetical protein